MYKRRTLFFQLLKPGLRVFTAHFDVLLQRVC